MKPDELIRLAEDEFKFGWPLRDWGARFSVKRNTYSDEVVVRFVLEPPHRDTGARGSPLANFRAFRTQLIEQIDRPMATSLLRQLAMDMLAHEVDESILINGDRAFDPHRPGVVG